MLLRSIIVWVCVCILKLLVVVVLCGHKRIVKATRWLWCYSQGVSASTTIRLVNVTRENVVPTFKPNLRGLVNEVGCVLDVHSFVCMSVHVGTPVCFKQYITVNIASIMEIPIQTFFTCRFFMATKRSVIMATRNRNVLLPFRFMFVMFSWERIIYNCSYINCSHFHSNAF